MPCVRPATRYFVNGKWTFNEPAVKSLYRAQSFGCRQCAPCKLAASGQWSTRIQHEALMHAANCCVTLTYDDEHLPELGSLRADHFTVFMRELRRLVAARGGPLLRYDAVGEYGERTQRPHVHAILFGYRPVDGVWWNKARSGNDQFTSAELHKAWSGKGRVLWQEFGIGAADYVAAGHQAARVGGDAGRLAHVVLGLDGRAIGSREPEFHRCSTMPGIGRSIMVKHGKQILQNGFTVASRREVPIPTYYLRVGDELHPELAAKARADRQAAVLELASRTPCARFEAIELCADEKIKRAVRASV